MSLEKYRVERIDIDRMPPLICVSAPTGMPTHARSNARRPAASCLKQRAATRTHAFPDRARTSAKRVVRPAIAMIRDTDRKTRVQNATAREPDILRRRADREIAVV